jgi:hypothetical protein
LIYDGVYLSGPDEDEQPSMPEPTAGPIDAV